MISENNNQQEISSLGIRLPPTFKQEDFYYEGGVMIFTAAYLLKRGSCCGCGCRHCPYDEAGNALGTSPSDPAVQRT